MTTVMETKTGSMESASDTTARRAHTVTDNARWSALNTPVGVVVSGAVAIGTMMALLMTLFFGQLNRMEDRLDRMEDRLGEQIDELRTEVGKLRTEVGELRAEVGQLRTEVGDIRTEIVKLWDAIP